jgi:hypothetical protein
MQLGSQIAQPCQALLASAPSSTASLHKPNPGTLQNSFKNPLKKLKLN